TSTPEPTPVCTPPTPTPQPTDTPVATDTPPSETPLPEPTAAPTDAPSAASTETPTEMPTPLPATSSPTVAVVPVASARSLALGSTVAIRGVLTTPFGLLDAGRHAYLQDETGGISLLAEFDAPLLPVATDLQLFGTVTSSSGELTLEIAQPADVIVFGTAS